MKTRTDSDTNLRTETDDQRGGSEWELIKILLERDGHSNKMNTTTKHISNSTTQLGQDHVATGVLLVLGTNALPSEPKLTNTRSGNLHGLLPVLHRSDRWPASVRPVNSTGQVGGYRSRTTNIPGSLSDSSRPWKKNRLQNTTATKENPSQNLAKQLQTSQELTSRTTGQNHTNKAVPRDKSYQGLAPIRPVKSTGQTGRAWAARDEQHPRVNSLKSNSDLPIRSTDSNKTLSIVGTPHGYSIDKLWSTNTR
jgi:hypothetical protein